VRYRSLGTHGPLVSEIGFGTGDNAGLMILGDERERRVAVARALEIGINYFDTAPAYGKGLAESNLGKALREVGGEAIVCTKVEIMPDTLDDIEGVVTRSLDASLSRLGMDTVDVLMMHNPPRLQRDPGSTRGWTPLAVDDYLGPVLRGLERARTAGKTRHLAFTCEMAEPTAVKTLIETGHFTAINAWYNLINPSAGMEMPSGFTHTPENQDYGAIMNRAAECGVGVAVIRPLAGGALTSTVISSGVAGRHALAGGGYGRRPERFEPEIERGRTLAFLETPSRTLAQAAFTFALMHPAVTTVLGGFSDLAHIDEMATIGEAPPFTADELAQIHAVYAHTAT
jgi:aryl-alcohol dehydrogenase-like predicted oxidoreductase